MKKKKPYKKKKRKLPHDFQQPQQPLSHEYIDANGRIRQKTKKK